MEDYNYCYAVLLPTASVWQIERPYPMTKEQSKSCFVESGPNKYRLILWTTALKMMGITPASDYI